MAKKQSDELDNFNSEASLIILISILKEVSENKKIDKTTRNKIAEALNKTRFTQNIIASILGMSKTDVNKILKRKP